MDIAATGWTAAGAQRFSVISNNLANMNTTAYKRRRTEFHDLLYQNLRCASARHRRTPERWSRAGVQMGLGVKLAAVYRIHEQGNLNATDNTFDLAVQGPASSRWICRTAKPPTPATAPSS